MEFNATADTDVCVFTSLFDSKNKFFKISYGSISLFDNIIYSSSFFTDNLTVPFNIEYENKIKTFEKKGSSFVKFNRIRFDNVCYPFDSYFFLRETKVQNDFENMCQMDFMLKSNSNC